jgi:Xaa-Pro aminopeptidase
VNTNEFANRRANLLPVLKQSRTDAFLTTALPNVHYLSGFTGSNGAVLVTDERALLFTDPRYQTQAPEESDCEVKIIKGSVLHGVFTWVRRLNIKTLAVEQNRLSFQEFQHLESAAPKLRLRPLPNVVEQLRTVKSPAEIATIRASVELNSKALQQALKRFKHKMTEVDLAAEIEYRMRHLGAEGTAFETIVASGPRTALPHAHPTSHCLQVDELLLVDMGARVAGYASDMTRTFAIGKLGPKAKRMYKAVLESQLAAIDAVKPGVTSATVDRAARAVLRGYGLDKLFIHSTGHGLGLEIHEAPRLGRKDSTKLAPGMAITIEPGVYLEGVGGVRIEDTVVVTENGCDVLTPTSKELVTL